MIFTKNRTILLSVLCSGCALVLAGLNLSGMQVSEAGENPVAVRPVPQEPRYAKDPVVLADRLLQRESDNLLVDPVCRGRLIREIGQVLVRVRNAYPAMAEISARQAHEPGTLLLGLEPDLFKAVSGLAEGEHGSVTSDTGYAKLDALHAKLGLSGVQPFPHTGVVVLHFSGQVNLEAACRAYRGIPRVRFCEPDARLGDGPDIEVSKLHGTWHIVARKAWGDCPAGCIHEELLFFTVENDKVSRVEALQAMDRTGFAALVANRGWD